MQTKSIFSNNTNLTGFQTNNGTATNSQIGQVNTLHDYYHKILPNFSKEYPYLTKILYLQLILRENILIFTQDRVDIRDIWLSISKMLQLKKPQIYIIDGKINMKEFLQTKNEYGRVLLYNVSKMSAEMVNKILNCQANISILGVESKNQNLDPHITDLFSMIILYDEQKQVIDLVNNYNIQFNNKLAQKFDKKAFNQCVNCNFERVVQQNEEEGFLKPFLSLLQLKLDKNQLKVSQSKWKKMLRILKFIGVNKQEGLFKRMTLGDFILAPQFLASSVAQLNQHNDIIFEVLVEFVPYFGIQKFEKSIRNHFWFSTPHHQLMNKIVQTIDSRSISFFYPCIKYPQTATIKLDEESSSIYYQIFGYEKKLMSDHHYEISAQQKYKLQVEIKSDCKMIIHLGLACYDKLKNPILPVQVFRRENSEVVFEKLEGDKLYVKDAQNLKNWANNEEDFAYQRAIGVYFNGQTQEVPPTTQIIYNSKQPYSKLNRIYQQIHISENQNKQSYIILSPETKQWLSNFRHLLEKDKTTFMNHYEGGSGCIGETLDLNGENYWKKIQIQYDGINQHKLIKNFYPGCTYIRVVLMVNYNSSYPYFQIHNKKGHFMFKNIKFKSQHFN